MAAVTWLLQSGSLWEVLTQSDSNGQKSLESHHPRILFLVQLVLSAFPCFKEQKGSIYSIYMRKGKKITKKLVKKVQMDAGSEEGTGWEGCSERSKTYHKVFKEFVFSKQHCAAVVECSFSASLTEW